MNKNYVVKSDRLRNFLYALGFNYLTRPDLVGDRENIYLFIKGDKLMEAITFYTKFKKQIINNNM